MSIIQFNMNSSSLYHNDDDNNNDDNDDHNDTDITNKLKDMIIKSKNEIKPSIYDPRDEATPDHWILRNATMIRATGKHPYNCEPPLSLLMHYGFITPTPLHFVRNHGPVAHATWDDWTVEITGFVKKQTRLSMSQLVNTFKSVEFPVTLVCSGNRRKEHNMVKKTNGFNWGPSAVSTSVYRGVPLCDVLTSCGIMCTKHVGALNVCFEGAEDLHGGGGPSKYGTSFKLEVAMDPSRDIILAYMMNGERLSPDHGFPVRVIAPGFIGGRMVKWLRRIVVSSDESDSYYHYNDNKVFPSHVDSDLANSQAWWYKQEYIINELNINSVITTPSHEEILPINAWTTQRPYTLRGYAYSGGGRKVTRVEVTMDEGEKWHVALLNHIEKGSRYGKYWCWCFWSFDVDVLDLVGTKEIAVRAWDESHNTQPHKLIWNVMGLMNNCWFLVKIKVCKTHKGEIGLTFAHPTEPGNKSGGWMDRVGGSSLNRTISTQLSSKRYSMCEVKKHNYAESAWIVVHGHVYDSTRYLKDHPGGSDSILINAGTDCTEEFDAIHSDKAKKLLEDFSIGELLPTGFDSTRDLDHGGSDLVTVNEVASPCHVALTPRKKISCQLIEKVSISRDVRKFRFALPSKDQALGLPVGKHVFLCATIDEELCMRPYAPISSIEDVGYFDLMIKIYFKGQNPKYPSGGLMSQYLESLQLGSILQVKGPLGHIEYLGRGNFKVYGNTKSATKLALIAGGTGITPIYQVMQAILKDPEDATEMYLVYGNRTEEDIMMKKEIDQWVVEYGNRLRVWYVIQEIIGDVEWKYDTGLITEKMLRDHVPQASSNVLALTCGPTPMIQSVLSNLVKIGYDDENLLAF